MVPSSVGPAKLPPNNSQGKRKEGVGGQIKATVSKREFLVKESNIPAFRAFLHHIIFFSHKLHFVPNRPTF